jgi:microcystin-dependent protein
MTSGLYKWSTTAGSNASADSSINWQEGQAPSSVNDSARAMMARLAEWRNDTSGNMLYTTGTLTAYVVASNQVFDSLADMSGQMIAFNPHVTNGTPVTLNVDGLGAKPLRFGPTLTTPLELQTGVLIQGTPYLATYNNGDGAWYLQGGFNDPYGVPIGGLLPYIGWASTPNSAFVFPYGQAISRTGYAKLFAMVNTQYGGGNGSTTFNVPDLRGRAVFGLDNLGGSAANLITAAGGNFDGTVTGGTGGGQNQTLTTAQVPNGAPQSSGTAAISVNTGSGTSGVQSGGSFQVYDVSRYATITVSGSGGPHPIMPPAITLPYILRVI